MKNNGAIRKVMFIVLLSILGSYCIGSDQQDSMQGQTNFGGKGSASAKKKAPKVKKTSISKKKSLKVSPKKQSSQIVKSVASQIKAQKKAPFITYFAKNDQVHGNDSACTDGRDDCVYDEHFFNDTWFTGKLDEDPTTHLDPDTNPMVLIDDLAAGA